MFEGKVGIVTGSSQGIGAGIVKVLASKGAAIVVNYPFDSELEKAESVVREIKEAGGKAIAIRANVSNEEEVAAMVEKTVEAFGRVDILVNNAGINRDTSLKKMTLEKFKSVLDTNLIGTYVCTQAVAEIMSEQGYGRIVNLSSLAGVAGNFGQSNYAASKAGVIGFTKTVARELARKGITVNAIAPGLIKTPMTEALPEDVIKKLISDIPAGIIGEPKDIANAVAFLASEDARFITGQVLNVNGGAYM